MCLYLRNKVKDYESNIADVDEPIQNSAYTKVQNIRHDSSKISDITDAPKNPKKIAVSSQPITCVKFPSIMLPLNGTLALYSALTSTGIFTCNTHDVSTLYASTLASPIMYFQCLVITGLAHPSYCDNHFYNVLTSSCISCTFSTLSSDLQTCFSQCADVAEGDFCATCTSAYISKWHSACAPTIAIDQPVGSEFPASCYVSGLPSLGSLDTVSQDLMNCLALNVTRDVECMSSKGYDSLDSVCTGCLYAVEDLTDAACEPVCVGRPFSSLCRKCVSAYVQTVVSTCYKDETFTISLPASCDSEDLVVLGSNPSSVVPVVNQCIDGQSCESSLSSLSSQCSMCLNSAEISDCPSPTDCVPASSLLDCVEIPVVDPVVFTIPSTATCLFTDMAQFSFDSLITQQVNACLYASTDASTCFSPIVQSILISPECSACFEANIGLNLDCSGSCDTMTTTGEDETAKSPACQTCLATAYSSTILDCFSVGVVSHCDAGAIGAISENLWGSSIFVRCLLDSGDSMSTSAEIDACVASAGFGTAVGSACSNCITETVIEDTECQATCKSDFGADACRACVAAFPEKATRFCSTSSRILAGGDSNNASSKSFAMQYDAQTGLFVVLATMMYIYN